MSYSILAAICAAIFIIVYLFSLIVTQKHLTALGIAALMTAFWGGIAVTVIFPPVWY